MPRRLASLQTRSAILNAAFILSETDVDRDRLEPGQSGQTSSNRDEQQRPTFSTPSAQHRRDSARPHPPVRSDNNHDIGRRPDPRGGFMDVAGSPVSSSVPAQAETPPSDAHTFVSIRRAMHQDRANRGSVWQSSKAIHRLRCRTGVAAPAPEHSADASRPPGFAAHHSSSRLTMSSPCRSAPLRHSRTAPPRCDPKRRRVP